MWALPGYAEIRELGAGAQGRVVLAVDEASGRTVAIKYLNDLDPAGLELFRSEAGTLRRVSSPHVAAVHEFVEAQGGAAIVMEAVEGGSLRALLDQHDRLAPEAALTVLKGSLLGLDAAHVLGIVHRDYKPANVIVSPAGVSKLIDFGVAVFAGTSRAAGTPTYMAPEIWSRGPATPATDVYSATCVFFECVTGHRPFIGGDLAVRHLREPVPLEDVPEELRGLIERGMAKSPAGRPPAAAAFVTELEAVAAQTYGRDWEAVGLGVLGGLIGSLGVVAVAAGAAITGAVAGGGVAAGSGTAAAATGATGVIGAAGGSKTTLAVASAVIGTAVAGGAAFLLTREDEAPARQAAAAAPPALAYLASSKLQINEGGKVRTIWNKPGPYLSSALVWSDDGSLLAWRSVVAPGNGSVTRRVHMTDRQGSRVQSWSCTLASCTNLRFAGNDLVTEGDQGRNRPPNLALYTFGSAKPRIVKLTGLRPREATRPMALNAVTPDGIMVAVAGPGALAHYRVTPQGKATFLAEDPHGSPEFATLSPDRRTLAYVPYGKDLNCFNRVRKVSLLRGSMRTSVDVPAGTNIVTFLAWSPDGTLYASFWNHPRPCAYTGSRSSRRSSFLHRLDGNTWTRAGKSTVDLTYGRDGSYVTTEGLRTLDFGVADITSTVHWKNGTTTVLGRGGSFAWSPK